MSLRSPRQKQLTVKGNGVHLVTATGSKLLERFITATLFRSGELRLTTSDAKTPTGVEERTLYDVTPAPTPCEQNKHLCWFTVDERIILFDRTFLLDARRVDIEDAVPPYPEPLRDEIRTMREPGCCVYVLEFVNHYTLLNIDVAELGVQAVLRTALRNNESSASYRAKHRHESLRFNW